MALVYRKRFDATIRANNKEFIEKLKEETGLNYSTICDLAFDNLKIQLKTKTTQELIKECKDFTKNSK